jgi:hypothetical protein
VGGLWISSWIAVGIVGDYPFLAGDFIQKPLALYTVAIVVSGVVGRPLEERGPGGHSRKKACLPPPLGLLSYLMSLPAAPEFK